MVSACVVSLARSNSERRQNARLVQRRRYLAVGLATSTSIPGAVVIAWTSSGIRIGAALSFLRDGRGQTGAVYYTLRPQETTLPSDVLQALWPIDTRGARQLLQPEQLAP